MPKKNSRNAKQPHSKKQPRRRQGNLVDHSLMKALSHPLRTEILAILTERPASPNGLSKELEAGLSQVSYHFTELKKAKLTKLVREEPRRGAVEHFYKAVRKTLVPKGVWKRMPAGVQQNISTEIMHQVFDDVAASMDAGIFDDPDSYASWSPLVVDREGFKKVDELANQFLEDVFDVQAESDERLAERSGERLAITVALVSFLATRSDEDSGMRRGATKRR